ncbi:S-(hydroxymethyl)glutathione dehydrogenase/alcohol dehydrogenase [Rathayibacter sp. PhB93]|uniref:zinc-binding dehydrogenase n=1 Tax=unclassified Rathayibacter TaxID=2609250 RepID=UPI000FB2D3DA|nr:MULTISPECIES: zinc-binding dehydrogenase [unclassified Rathayibacter]ROQ04478.1 S-(hydroxymethyl)glutathione dehydrogenase/alcohol dehydrogenase [Rathayibacter sp. PhB93]TDQ13316.1 S-(hydroxymethyl)glutathione dehydrogenase/alcohol dehydrogenase [Rathayibacter sp. PhB1]
MSTRMRAAVLREFGAPLAVEELDVADPGRGELLVEIDAAGVCHSDLHYLRGDLRCPLPVVPGHEGAGRIVALGPDLREGFAVGDRVALLWRPNCGRCRQCVAGRPIMCEYGPVQAASGGLLDGTSRLSAAGETVHHLLGVSCFAERVVVPERSVVRVPDDVPAEIAAIAGCAVITGVGAVLNVIGACLGDAVVVIGAGGVGLSAVMGARAAGATTVVAVDVDADRLALARRLGATHAIDGSSGSIGGGDTVEQLLALVPGGVPWVVEAVGRPETLASAVAMLQQGGTAVAVGLGRVGQSVGIPVNDLVQKQKRVVGSLYGSSIPQLDLPRIFELYRRGALPLDELVGERFALEDIGAAFEALEHGSVGRSIVVPAREGVR